MGSVVKKRYLDNYGILSHNKEKVKEFEKGTKILHQKFPLDGGLLSERIIWKLSPTIQYPLGFKYRWILVNPITCEVILLYDNHWPKGPHIHGSKGERPYEFINLEELRKDFILESGREEKKYHENKKNSY
ncbi:MAG: DUF6516 family protein [Bacteriovoracales bacterium]